MAVNEEKQKAFNLALKQIDKTFGKNSLIRMGDAPRKDIELLINQGDRIIENDVITLEKVADKSMKGYEYKGDYKLLVPASIHGGAKELDQLLGEIKVADPAVGSGAFPVGMMNEIIRTRNALTPYIGKNGKRTPYNFKRQAIQNCLYGVDIDSGAVEIAKLRLWLSLVVDEEERETIQPLPNTWSI